MNRRGTILLTSFIIISGLIFLTGTYLVKIVASSPFQFFITFCGEVFKDIRKHTHINPGGVTSSLILSATIIGVSLAIMQVVKFALSHQQLSKKHWDKVHRSQKLNWIIRRHKMQHVVFTISDEDELTAYTTGLIRPRIVVSRSLIRQVNRSQLEAIILHEFYHVQNRHVWWLLLTRATSALLFFVPLIGYLAQQLKTEFELAADSFVVQKQKTRHHICSSLALNLKYANSVMPHFAASPIEQRVESLITKKSVPEKVRKSQLGISLLSIGFMIGLIFIQPDQATATFSNQISVVCLVEEGCQTADCVNHQNVEESYEASFMSSSF